jgi:peptide/nickel transport system substrate-binding protein
MKRFEMFVLALLLVTTILMTLMTLASSVAAAEKRGGTLVAVINHAPRHFNGAVQSGIATMFSSSQLFATPLMFDDKWQPQPYLAFWGKL